MFDLRSRLLICSTLIVVSLCTSNRSISDDQTTSSSTSGYQELQAAIDAAAAHDTVRFDPAREFILEQPVHVNKPITITGLNASLPPELGKSSLMIVQSDGVTIRDFEMIGNADSVVQKMRAPLLQIRANDFRVENGVFRNGSKDGVMIESVDIDGADREIAGGVIRDIVGYDMMRDLVSIGGGNEGSRVRNVLVENIRCYGNPLRGAVEVSDGTAHITVRKVYAERCVYAVDVQDHGKSSQINGHILIQDVYAKECGVAIRNDNRPFGHHDLTIRDVTAEDCHQALRLKNTKRLTVDNIRVLGHGDGEVIPIRIFDCDSLSISNVFFSRAHPDVYAMAIQDCHDVRVAGVSYQGALDGGGLLNFVAIADEVFSGLHVSGVCGVGLQDAIVLSRENDNGGLTDYLITGNMATVQDQINGERGFVTGNIDTVSNPGPDSVSQSK